MSPLATIAKDTALLPRRKKSDIQAAAAALLPFWSPPESEIPSPPVFPVRPIFPEPTPLENHIPEEYLPREMPTPVISTGESDFTDADLFEALVPLFHEALKEASASADPHLAGLLQASSPPAAATTSLDRFRRRMLAIFTSRTYEDVMIEETDRCEIDEVYLLDSAARSVISHASSSPQARVRGVIRRLLKHAFGTNGRIRASFQFPNDRQAISHQGKFTTLVVVFRGRAKESLRAKLASSLESIEANLRERLETNGSPLISMFQPFLEQCLVNRNPDTVS